MDEFRKQSWLRKFSNAFRGIRVGLRSQNSFWFQLPCAILVTVLAIWLRVSWAEGAILGLCIVVVLAVEFLNTAIEFLSREVTTRESDLVRDSLDTAAGAVLVASLGAAVIGVMILLPKLLEWWTA